MDLSVGVGVRVYVCVRMSVCLTSIGPLYLLITLGVHQGTAAGHACHCACPAAVLAVCGLCVAWRLDSWGTSGAPQAAAEKGLGRGTSGSGPQGLHHNVPTKEVSPEHVRHCACSPQCAYQSGCARVYFLAAPSLFRLLPGYLAGQGSIVG